MYIKYILRTYLFLLMMGGLSQKNVHASCKTLDLIPQNNKTIISGKVTDKDGNGLEFASVFIANTTFGTITNEEGEYSLENIPFGSHMMVVSYIGYQFIKVTIHLDKPKYYQNFQLKKLDVELSEIEVRAQKSKNNWKNNYKKFEENFIGTSKNSNQCKIINPQHLRFHYDRKEKVLRAQSNEMLIIENKALGYKIQYLLENFELKKDGSFKYMGSANFEILEASTAEIEKLWLVKRKEAYYGSIKHFLRSLYMNKLTEEGYFVISTNAMLPLKSYNELQKKLDPYKEPVGKELILLPGNYFFERKISFANYLYVVYTKESEEYYFIGTINPEYKSIPFQQSWIQLSRNPSDFNILGYYNNPTDVIVYGNWASEKLAESLPKDYLPEKNN